MGQKEINRLIDTLFDAVEKSGWSSKIYHDEDWSGLYRIREVCGGVLPQGWRCLRQHIYGYSNDNRTKHYLFTIENEETGERIIDVLVNAHSAGTVANIWSGYDCTATFYPHLRDDF